MKIDIPMASAPEILNIQIQVTAILAVFLIEIVSNQK